VVRVVADRRLVAGLVAAAAKRDGVWWLP